MNQSELQANTCSVCQARENAREQVTISFGLTSDWSRKWRETFWLVTMRSNANQSNRVITLKITIYN